MKAIEWVTATDALHDMITGTLTSESLVQQCLGRLEAREPDVGAWSYLNRTSLLNAARRIDEIGHLGRLHGLPIAIKDLFSTYDMPTTCGSSIYAGHVPASDAAVVALIRRAGGIIMGKTVTTEFAFFTPGKTRNPHGLDRTPGGSSSGSAAAVADGMAPLALGTQTAGSIIRPASFCGVVGYKPTYGMISTTGLKVGAWSLDTIGVFARNVPDAALLAGVLSDQNLDVGWSEPVYPHIGLCRTPQWESATVDTEHALKEAVRRVQEAGGVIEEVTLPASFSQLLKAQHTIMIYEAARSLAFERDVYSDQLSNKLKDLLDDGIVVSREEYSEAQRIASLCRSELDNVFAKVDVLLTPSAPGEAPMRKSGTGDPVFNRIWTLLHTPCVNVPGMSGSNGLPIGVQVIGPIHGDHFTLKVSNWLASLLAGEACWDEPQRTSRR